MIGVERVGTNMVISLYSFRIEDKTFAAELRNSLQLNTMTERLQNRKFGAK